MQVRYIPGEVSRDRSGGLDGLKQWHTVGVGKLVILLLLCLLCGMNSPSYTVH
jgi:hypothetical protein